MIEIDKKALTEQLKGYQAGIQRYTRGMRGLHDSVQRVVESSLADQERMQDVLGQLDGSIEKAMGGMRGVSSLVQYANRGGRRIPLNTLQKENPVALDIILQERIKDNHGFWARIPFVRRSMSVDRALSLIAQGLERAPAYVQKGLEEVEEAHQQVGEYKSGLRQKINEAIESRVGIEDTLTRLWNELDTMEQRYGALENERKSLAVQEKPSEPAKLAELQQLDVMIGDYRDAVSKAELEIEEGHNLIELINGQVDKLDQYQKLIGDSLKTIRRAKAHIDLQVPYALQEIRGQRAMTMGLTAVNNVIKFLQAQLETSREYNRLLRSAIADTDCRTKAFQSHVMEPRILPEDKTVAGYLPAQSKLTRVET